MILYQLILFGSLLLVLYLVANINEIYVSLNQVYSEISADQDPSYTPFESVLSARFNQFYFSAVNACSGE